MLSVIPKPKLATELKGSFSLPESAKAYSDFDMPLLAQRAQLCQTADEACIVISRDESLAKEGYILDVTVNGIIISANNKIGAYYALQTVRKLCHYDTGGRQVPCCHIEDEPRFSFRGISLDVSRHFYSVEYIKQFLDWIFMEKLNVFHWHLTDDNGWRIEIKKFPLLTEIGSKRSFTQIGGWKCAKMEKKEYGGYYTQEQIKDVVAYAKERGITVIPEIDFPAHCAAAFAAYNNLACREEKTDVFGFFGGLIPVVMFKNHDWNRTLCMGKDETFEFVYGVLDEVCELFDSPFIHLGGDEAPKNEWKKCSRCQQVMKENNLKNEDELQGWFENKLCEYLKTKGKRMIGWNEILAAKNVNNEEKSIVAQYWTPQRDKNAEEYVNNGGQMIMSNHRSFYFDMTYGQYPLKYTYDYSLKKYGVTDENVKNVLGVEGELWTEWIRDKDRLEMLAFPRIQALAEVAWTPEGKRDFNDFKARLDDYKPTFDALGINYAVDKVCMIKNPIKRKHIVNKFFRGNPDLENQLNAEYKAKGDR